jgi:hypothetical protein
MNESRSNFAVLDSYSASTHCQSFQKQYSSVTQFQVTPKLPATPPIAQIFKATSILKT